MTVGGLETRRRLLELVEQYPGLHLRELARQCRMSEALAAHHLDALLAARLVRSETADNYRRFFGTGSGSPSARDAQHLVLLRQRLPLQIVLYLLERERATNQELADRFRLAKSTLSYHVGYLVDQGVVRRDEVTGMLALDDPAGMERLLLRWRGPASLTGRFVELWDDFYGRRGARRPKA